MKILFLSGNLCDGGAQRVIAVVSSHLAEKGHDVSVLLFSRNEKEYPLSDKVNVISVANSFEEYSSIGALSRIKIVRNYIKSIKPDVAVGFLEGGYALYLSSFGMKFTKIASVRNAPDVVLKAKGFREVINRRWFNSADVVVLQTNSQVKFVNKRMQKRSIVIENAVSDKALDMVKKEYSANCRNIVMVGRLEEQKNYGMAFAAFEKVVKKYPDIKVKIFGKGALAEQISEELGQRGLLDNVGICGWSQNVIEEYNKSDLYILSSDYEGMPNALMEAMAVGLPCISTDCNTGPADLIENEKNGFLVPVGDSDALAERIIEVIEMPEEQRNKLGENAHKTLADKFNTDVICKKWEELFERFMDKKR